MPAAVRPHLPSTSLKGYDLSFSSVTLRLREEGCADLYIWHGRGILYMLAKKWLTPCEDLVFDGSLILGIFFEKLVCRCY